MKKMGNELSSKRSNVFNEYYSNIIYAVVWVYVTNFMHKSEVEIRVNLQGYQAYAQKSSSFLVKGILNISNIDIKK